MHKEPNKERKKTSRGIGYPISIFYLYTSPDEAFEVYAMDVEDAYECLFENEPKLTVDSIIMVKEHKCPTKKEIVN